jgi:tRNA-2-methylthio-N6-dimethylallyladenosine synthase
MLPTPLTVSAFKMGICALAEGGKRMAECGNKTYFIRTFGCQMNEHDSGRMGSLLEGLGYTRAPSLGDADVLLINTCSVREKPYHKAMSEAGRARDFKARRGSLIGVCGCVAQQEGARIIDRYGHVDFVFGPDQIAKLPEMIKAAKAGRHSVATTFIDDPNHPDFPHAVAEGMVQGGSAFVAIMKGCNCSCAYCIVPSVRGPEVSRDAEGVIAEVKSVVVRGAKEVTLLGQNVNAYGRGADTNFVELLERIASETDVERIRYTSPHPKDVTDDLIELYRTEKKLCPHIHLPVQAGSNAVLKTMRRGYARERIFEQVDKLRAARSGIAITTDMIVGFCGETDTDFQDTIDLMKRVRFDSMFAFCYSTRPGTYAAEQMKDDVPLEEKQKRLEEVLELQRTIQGEANAKLVGKDVDVLVAGVDAKNEGKLTGRAGDNRLIHFAGNSDLVGSIVRVHVTKGSMHSLQGEMR